MGLRVDLRAKEADSAYAAPPNDAHTRMLAALLNPMLNASLEVCRPAIQASGYPALPVLHDHDDDQVERALCVYAAPAGL